MTKKEPPRRIVAAGERVGQLSHRTAGPGHDMALAASRQLDKGFTLVELMVVVFILSALMAIAVPTFLSTTRSARAASTESNATNATVSEVANYTTASEFVSSAGGPHLDPSMPWVPKQNTAAAVAGQVLVSVFDVSSGSSMGTNKKKATYSSWSNASGGSTGNVMALLSLSADNTCYGVLDDQTLPTPFIGYYEWADGCPSSVGPASETVGSYAPSAGSAAKNASTAAKPAWPTTLAGFYSSF
jgi:type IV pilus assembly protein PilA